MTHITDSITFSCFYSCMFKKDLEFEIGDYVYLKSSLMKGMKIFGKKGKICPRCVDSFKILNHFGKVAYELKLPLDLTSVHLVFHSSLLKKVHR